MKTLLSRSITAPAAIIAVTLATPTVAKEADIESLVAAAQKEGAVYSVGMPDSWANWKDTWADLKSNYNLKHQDTDMSSAQEIAKFEAEKKNATADIGDVGFAFARVAVKKKASLSHINQQLGMTSQIGQKTKMVIGHLPTLALFLLSPTITS